MTEVPKTEVPKIEVPKIEVTGIDHIYIAVSNLARSEIFYDRVPRRCLKGTIRDASVRFRRWPNAN